MCQGVKPKGHTVPPGMTTVPTPGAVALRVNILLTFVFYLSLTMGPPRSPLIGYIMHPRGSRLHLNWLHNASRKGFGREFVRYLKYLLSE